MTLNLSPTAFFSLNYLCSAFKCSVIIVDLNVNVNAEEARCGNLITWEELLTIKVSRWPQRCITCYLVDSYTEIPNVDLLSKSI